jgi:MazG family protein
LEDPELNNKKSPLKDLINLIERLRGPNGCPWDKKQAPQSMVIYLIEEIYELAEAIRSDHPDDVCEELGDVLFHIFFLARMFQEKGHFSIDEVARLITEKMIRRHPHVFGTQQIDNSEDIAQNWQTIKQTEKNHAAKKSVLDSIPAQMPALLRAYLIADRASKSGFEADKNSQSVSGMETELVELESALRTQDKDRLEQQCGDFLFNFVDFSRSVGIHPETALAGAINRFEGRFKRVEKQIADSGRTLEKVSQTEKDQIWEE